MQCLIWDITGGGSAGLKGRIVLDSDGQLKGVPSGGEHILAYSNGIRYLMSLDPLRVGGESIPQNEPERWLRGLTEWLAHSSTTSVQLIEDDHKPA